MSNPVARIPIVLNDCFGGFGLSPQARSLLIGRKGWAPAPDGDSHYVVVAGKVEFLYDVIARTDEDLVAVVLQLGSQDSSDEGSRLTVCAIPLEVEIESIDGKESARLFGRAIMPPRRERGDGSSG